MTQQQTENAKQWLHIINVNEIEPFQRHFSEAIKITIGGLMMAFNII